MGGYISNTALEIVEVLNLDTNIVETLPGPGFQNLQILKNTKFITETNDNEFIILWIYFQMEKT